LNTGDYRISQRWAHAFQQHPSQPDGIYYRARHDTERFSVALFACTNDYDFGQVPDGCIEGCFTSTPTGCVKGCTPATPSGCNKCIVQADCQRSLMDPGNQVLLGAILDHYHFSLIGSSSAGH